MGACPFFQLEREQRDQILKWKIIPSAYFPEFCLLVLRDINKGKLINLFKEFCHPIQVKDNKDQHQGQDRLISKSKSVTTRDRAASRSLLEFYSQWS